MPRPTFFFLFAFLAGKVIYEKVIYIILYNLIFSNKFFFHVISTILLHLPTFLSTFIFTRFFLRKVNYTFFLISYVHKFVINFFTIMFVYKFCLYKLLSM